MRLALAIVLALSIFSCSDDSTPPAKDGKVAVEASVKEAAAKETATGKEASVVKEASAPDAAVATQ